MPKGCINSSGWLSQFASNFHQDSLWIDCQGVQSIDLKLFGSVSSSGCCQSFLGNCFVLAEPHFTSPTVKMLLLDTNATSVLVVFLSIVKLNLMHQREQHCCYDYFNKTFMVHYCSWVHNNTNTLNPSVAFTSSINFTPPIWRFSPSLLTTAFWEFTFSIIHSCSATAIEVVLLSVMLYF